MSLDLRDVVIARENLTRCYTCPGAGVGGGVDVGTTNHDIWKTLIRMLFFKLSLCFVWNGKLQFPEVNFFSLVIKGKLK